MSGGPTYSIDQIIDPTEHKATHDGLSDGSEDVNNNKLELFRSETLNDFVASGGVWSADSLGASLDGSMTSIVAYISGKRIAASAVSAHAFTASKFTAVDLGTDGTIDYNEGTAFSDVPALATNHIRIAYITTTGTAITVVYDRRNLSPWTLAMCELKEGTPSNISIESYPSRKVLQVIFLDNESATKILTLRFNNDSGTNYAWRKSVNGAADTTLGSTTGIPAESTSGTREILNYFVQNLIDCDEKVVTGTAVHSSSGGAGNAPGKDDVAGKWVSGASTLITAVHIVNTGGGATLTAGSKMIRIGQN